MSTDWGKMLIFATPEAPRPSHLAFVVRWVANRQAEQAVS